jgi:serine/threonine protein kinase
MWTALAIGSRVTRAQMIVGTPEYLSPEQAAGKVDDIDHRSDQWSLACIAWHMLVGQQPFFGPDVNAILRQVMEGEPPALPPTLAALLPGPVEQVLRRALSKRQQDRFPTITAFARTFEAAALPFAAGEAPSAKPARPVLVWILAAALAASLGLVAALLLRASPPPTSSPADEAPSSPSHSVKSRRHGGL